MSKVTETWLSDPASIKGILVEVTASIYDSVNLMWVETPLYLSNIGYLTTDNLTIFNPIIVGGLQITESISLEGSVSMSFGDIGLSNPNGDLDNWLDSEKYIWTNRAVKVYVGDPSWVCTNLAQIRTDFELVFSGLVSDIDASSREQVNLKIRDSLERLNTPLTENKLGTYGTWSGGQTNQDTTKPVVFGEAFNITPLLIDPSQLEYMYNEPKPLSLANLTQTNPALLTIQSQLATTTWGTTPVSAITWSSSLGLYVIVGNSGTTSKVASSPDGITWTVRATPAFNLNDVLWNNVIFVAVGGLSTAATTLSYIKSTDGINWTAATWAANGVGRSIAISNNSTNTIVVGTDNGRRATGPGTFATTFNGSSSSLQSLAISPWATTSVVTGIAYNGTVLCYIGTAGRCAYTVGTTTTGTTSLATALTSSTPTEIIWAGTQFCVGGPNAKIATSPDGITWTARTGLSNIWTTTPSVTGLTWTGTKIIAAGTGGKLAYSLDGVTWVDISELSSNSNWGTGVSLQSVNWNGTKLLIGGNSGKTATTNRDIPTGSVEIVCDNTSSLSVGQIIVPKGTSFGGISANTSYYIKSIPTSGILTLSTTLGGSAITVTTATGSLGILTSVGSEQLIEIRDNGVPIYNSTTLGGAIVNLNAGTFKLTKTPVGVVTASVQGALGNINLSTKAITATYKNTITNIIALICTSYGKDSTKLSTAELDLVNLNAFDLANTIPVGYYVQDRENVLTVCQNLLKSIEAQLYITKSGLLQILRIGVPTTDTVVNITDSDILQHSLSISNKLSVKPSNKLAYSKNYTVQSNLTTNIPDAHKATFAEEWLTTTATDNTVNNLYSLTVDPAQKDTCLVTNIDAYTEAVRLTNYYKTSRIVYKFTGRARLFILKLGQSVVLTHNRFNLSSGKTGQVISLNYDWIAGTVNVEVLV